MNISKLKNVFKEVGFYILAILVALAGSVVLVCILLKEDLPIYQERWARLLKRINWPVMV